MRRYGMRQKLFSLRDAFSIQDASGRDAYIVKGRLISLRDQLSFQEVSGEELLRITQKLVSLKPRYEISREGRHYATVSKRLLTLIGTTFDVSVDGAPDLVAKGNFLAYEYTFFQEDMEVAQVSKQWFSFSDSYGVQVSDAVDDLLILASTVIIDMINHSDGDKD